MVFSNSTQTFIPTEEKYKQKKFSTFLVKPDRPQLKPRKTEEQRQIEGDPYLIEIKRQSRRKILPKEKRVQFDQNITEVEIESVSSRTQDSPEFISPDPYSNGYEHESNYSEDHFNDDYENGYVTENGEYDTYEIEENGDTDEENDFHNEIRDLSEIQYKPISQIIIEDPNSEQAMTLEEQLKAVQKQLEALSLLPSEVQTALDAVSKQLASIVGTKKEDEEDVEENKDHDEFKEDTSDSVEAQADIEDGEDSIEGDELEEDSLVEAELEAILERARNEETDENKGSQECLEIDDDYVNEEELKLRREEEELLAKKEKEMTTHPPQKQKSNFRPIVLPGGRKWIDPDDVVPTRKPRMTDEKIMESIEGSLEVISGKRKGINFMKNTPPPKNLDHLQRSEVYRMIHGMEPPTRGITIRPEKILPEQDYYEASRRAP